MNSFATARRIPSCLVGLFALGAASSCLGDADFLPLGDLPGGVFESLAYAVSDDGTIVVGNSNTGEEASEAFRWTEPEGMIGLGDFPGGFFRSRAVGVSADGSVVVGRGSADDSIVKAYRWTISEGMVALGDLPGGNMESDAEDVSDDGGVIVGASRSSNGREAYRWTQESGMTGLGDLPGGDFFSYSSGVSADGSVVVGAGRAEGLDYYQAFRWTEVLGMQGLGDLPGGDTNSVAEAVSADGSVVIGHSPSANGLEAFRWTESEGMVGLGDLPGGTFGSVASDVSGDGEIVVGQSDTEVGSEGFIWTHSSGMLRLQDVLLVSAGAAALDGWSRLTPQGISTNGQWIVGFGTNPDQNTEAFRVRIDREDIRGFSINAGLNDSWYNPVTSGQGFFINVFPSIGQVFLAWFTYDTERPDESVTAVIGEPGHRWVTAFGPYMDGQAVLDIEITQGGVFNDSNPVPTQDLDGTITLDFSGCNTGTVSFDIPSIGQQGVIPIERIALDNMPACEALSGVAGDKPTAAVTTEVAADNRMDADGFQINRGLNDAWYNPLTSGQGFFMNVFPDIGQMFLAWFTYDTTRPPGSVHANLGDAGHRWMTAFGPYTGHQAELDIEITEGGVFNAAAPAPTQRTDGTVTVDMSDCENGTITYDIPSANLQGEIPIERIALDNVPVCQSLDGLSQQGPQ